MTAEEEEKDNAYLHMLAEERARIPAAVDQEREYDEQEVPPHYYEKKEKNYILYSETEGTKIRISYEDVHSVKDAMTFEDGVSEDEKITRAINEITGIRSHKSDSLPDLDTLPTEITVQNPMEDTRQNLYQLLTSLPERDSREEETYLVNEQGIYRTDETGKFQSVSPENPVLPAAGMEAAIAAARTMNDRIPGIAVSDGTPSSRPLQPDNAMTKDHAVPSGIRLLGS